MSNPIDVDVLKKLLFMCGHQSVFVSVHAEHFDFDSFFFLGNPQTKFVFAYSFFEIKINSS